MPEVELTGCANGRTEKARILGRDRFVGDQEHVPP